MDLSRYEKTLNVPKIFADNLQNVSIGEYEIFNRNSDSILESKLFGIPVKFIALAGILYWLLRK